MDTSKIDHWFKVAVDSHINDDWMIALFGRGRDDHNYAVVSNHVKASTLVDNSDVFRGAKGDAELVVELLNKWHSSRRSHPAMSNEDFAVSVAYSKHLSENHDADFETCYDPTCRLAVMLEVAYGWVNPETGTYDEERQ